MVINILTDSVSPSTDCIKVNRRVDLE